LSSMICCSSACPTNLPVFTAISDKSWFCNCKTSDSVISSGSRPKPSWLSVWGQELPCCWDLAWRRTARTRSTMADSTMLSTSRRFTQSASCHPAGGGPSPHFCRVYLLCQGCLCRSFSSALGASSLLVNADSASVIRASADALCLSICCAQTQF
jgi:hypothetical protein